MCFGFRTKNIAASLEAHSHPDTHPLPSYVCTFAVPRQLSSPLQCYVGDAPPVKVGATLRLLRTFVAVACHVAPVVPSLVDDGGHGLIHGEAHSFPFDHARARVRWSSRGICTALADRQRQPPRPANITCLVVKHLSRRRLGSVPAFRNMALGVSCMHERREELAAAGWYRSPPPQQ